MGNPSGMRLTAKRGCAGLAWLLLVLLCFVAPSVLADQIIPAGGKTLVSNGLFDLACTDLTVRGVLDTGTGAYANVRNVTVAPSGVIQGTGSINYSGTLIVSGTIQPGVKLVVNPPTNAACPGPAAVEGIPTLDSLMLLVLAMLLLGLASSAIREQKVLRRRRESKGADK
jgi:hypothetical protein